MRKIKDLPDFQRPREKLKELGPQGLSDCELISIILGSGSKGADVRTISQKVARILENNKGQINREQLEAVHGLGEVKISKLLAGFELARRYASPTRLRIHQPQDVLPLLMEIVSKKQEYFYCITLNGANEVIQSRVVTIGLLDRTQVHPREVFADALTDRAASVIFAHNHPSGDLHPSQADLALQQRLTKASEILGIRVLDHLIVSRNGFYSFRDEGLL